MANLPGNFLYRALRWTVDEESFQNLVLPALADLQHEVTAAGSSLWKRGRAAFLGYAGVFRVLCSYECARRESMARLFIVVMLGTAGGALAVGAASTSIGTAPMLALVSAGLAAAVVFRLMPNASSYGRNFLGALCAGTITVGVFWTWSLVADTPEARVWRGYIMPLPILLTAVALGSLFVAAAASTGVGSSTVRRRLTDILVAVSVFALVQLALLSSLAILGPSPLRPLLFAKPFQTILAVTSWTALWSFYYAGACLVLYLPVLLVARRIIAYRVVLVLLGALLFPLPLFQFHVVQTHFPKDFTFYWSSPREAFVAVALPLLTGGAVLGWLFGRRAPRAADAGV